MSKILHKSGCVAGWALFGSLGGLFDAVAFAETVPELPVIYVKDEVVSQYRTETARLGVLGELEAIEIPYSVHSFSEALIRNQQVRTIAELLKNDASVENFALGTNFDHLAIRGFSLDTRSSYCRNGLPFPGLADFPLEAVERVDVLHGASGLFHGFNKPGGAVDYVVKRPYWDNHLDVEGELSQFEGRYVHLDLGGPLADYPDIAQRWNLAAEKIGDFYHSGDLERWMASAAFEWRATDRLRVGLNGEFQHRSVVAEPQLPLTTAGTPPPPYDTHTLLGQPWARYTADAYQLQIEALYRLDDEWDLSVQVGYSDNRRDSVFPSINELQTDGTILDGEIWLAPGQWSAITSGEISLSGHFDTGDIAHQIILGMSGYGFDAENLGYFQVPLVTGNIYDPLYLPPPVLPEPPPKRTEKNRQSDLFIFDALTLSERWRLLAGLRYSDYHDRIYDAVTGELAREYRTHALAPSLGAVFTVDPSIRLYGSYVEGIEPGGLAPISSEVANAGEPMPPLTSKQIELGVKAELFDSLQFNATLFRIERTLQYINQQGSYVQDGLQSHKGLELSAQGDLTPRLSLVASATLLNPRMEEVGDPGLSGKRPIGVANRRASLFAEYQPEALPGWFFGLGVYYRGDSYYNASNTVKIPGYTRLDLALRYQTSWQDKRLVWRLNIDNLTDKFYWSSTAWDGLTAGVPRTVKLSLAIPF